MSATELAAWWGAGAASLVLIWDIYKWGRSGPLLDIAVSTSMESYGNMPEGFDGMTFVIVIVSNIGDRSTTLTHLIGEYFPSRLQWLLRRKEKSIYVSNPALDKPLPCVLKPGEQWSGVMAQDAEFEKLSREKLLYCGVFHSSSKRPALKRVVIHEEECT